MQHTIAYTLYQRPLSNIWTAHIFSNIFEMGPKDKIRIELLTPTPGLAGLRSLLVIVLHTFMKYNKTDIQNEDISGQNS